MILLDTSVRVDRHRKGEPALEEALERRLVLSHPFVIGELACGRPSDRGRILGLLGALPSAKPAVHEEVTELGGRGELRAGGLGWTDAHLLPSTLLTGCRLWTKDRALTRVAKILDVRA